MLIYLFSYFLFIIDPKNSAMELFEKKKMLWVNYGLVVHHSWSILGTNFVNYGYYSIFLGNIFVYGSEYINTGF